VEHIIEQRGFDFCFTATSIVVIAVAAITSLFIWDAKS
jgi:hypothetical protein